MLLAFVMTDSPHDEVIVISERGDEVPHIGFDCVCCKTI
jgi:hypothetical protein